MPRERSHNDRLRDGRPSPSGTGAMGERLMTALEVADLLAVPKTRVWSMSRRGEIPTVRLGSREVRYRRQDIEAWIARQY